MTLIERENCENSLRIDALLSWFQGLAPSLSKTKLNINELSLEAVSGDASFRRYFRARIGSQPYILVDAPPDKEDSHPFVAVAQQFSKYSVNVPKVFAVDYLAGFMCLSDFGDTLLWEKLDQASLQNVSAVTELYGLAFAQLLKIQACNVGDAFVLPLFNAELLHREMTLFKGWFCQDLLSLSLSKNEEELLESSFNTLIESALAQPQVCVHRDYHSRNLLFSEDQELGVIDFQDAVLGPLTYDLVSLIKDCYIDWPRSQVNTWALQYLQRVVKAGIVNKSDESDKSILQNEKAFLKSFDLMGVQRHLKAIGIFSRLYLRDKKSGYLGDIPRTLNYIRVVAQEQGELQAFSHWLESKVVPVAELKIQRLLASENAQ